MQHKLLLPLLGLTLLASLSLQAANGMGPQNPSQKMMKKAGKPNSPFLINGGLPHMSMMIKQNWDNPALALTAQQKEKLLVVRQTTMSSVQSIKPQTMQLSMKIKEMSRNAAAISKINPLIDELAQLKAQATKVHVKCIHNTKTILTPEQLRFLMQAR